MPKPLRHIVLTPEQDDELRQLELDANVHEKVRLRAKVIRLSSKNFTLTELAEHFDRCTESVRQDLIRYEQYGIKGLTDGKAKGQPTLFTPEISQFIQDQLAENRIWSCTLFKEAIQKEFGITIQREAIRTKLIALGYRWKRGRYYPAKQTDPEVVAAHQEKLEQLKRGL